MVNKYSFISATSRLGDQKYLNSILFGLCIAELVVFSCLFGIDTHVTQRLSDSGTFSLSPKYSGGVNMRSLLDAVLVLGIVYLIFLVFKAVHQKFNEDVDSSRISSWYDIIMFVTVKLCIEISRQAIFMQIILCINNYYQSFIKGRAALSFIIMFILIVYHIVSIFSNKEKGANCSKLLRSILIGFNLLICLAIIIFNIVILVKLKEGENASINPKEISVVLVSRNDIDNISNGVFVKDEYYYKYKLLTNLNEVINSKYKSPAYTRCTSNGKSTSCTTYYYRKYDIFIDCTDPDNTFYIDCNKKNVSSIFMRLQYLDDKKSYPKYNCVLLSGQPTDQFNRTCIDDCDFIYGKSIILTQDRDNVTEFAWTGFSDCNPYPKYTLDYDRSVNVCSSSNRLQFKWSLFAILIIITMKTFNF